MNDDKLARFLTGRADSAERDEVQAWRQSSAENERDFQQLARLLTLTGEVDKERLPGPAPAATDIIAAAEAARSAERSSNPTPHGRGRRALVWAPAVAAAAVVVSLGISQLGPATSPEPDAASTAAEEFGVQQFVTGPSEQATVVLTDGTVVRLSADSRLEVPDDADGREVSLVGRGYFAVTHDPSRPFRVRTASGDVRVLGTRFSLDTSLEDLRLVVVEGSVALDGPDQPEIHVAENQMARIVRGTRLPVVTVPDAILLADWVGDFLAFQDTPLHRVVDEIEREYGVQVVITDPVLAERTITAWFGGWSLEDVMEVVCIVASARCDVSDSLVTMQALQPSGP